jgi:dihydropyrimidinase
VTGNPPVTGNVAAVVGGTVATPEGLHRADVLIIDGKIAAIGEPGAAGGTGLDAARLDAGGCYVLPGGVDPHCHLMSQVHLATAAAARGGTTTALSFTNPEPGQGDLESLLRRREELGRGDAVIDVGLHAMLYDPERATFADLVAARRAGAAAVKVFLAYPELGIMCSTRRLHQLMSDARQAGLVVQVHCENGPLIETLVADAVRSGRRGEPVFADTRPPEVEEEARASRAQLRLEIQLHLNRGRVDGELRPRPSPPQSLRSPVSTRSSNLTSGPPCG